MQDLVKVAKKAILGAYKAIGKTPKQLKAMELDLIRTPREGWIGAFDTTPRSFQVKDAVTKKMVERQYFVYPIHSDKVMTKENKIGELSVNRPHDTYVVLGDYLVIAQNSESTHKGEAMLRSHRCSDLSELGTSQVEQMANIQGMRYTTEEANNRVLTLYTPEDMFVAVSERTGEPTKADIEKLNKNTSPKKQLIFSFYAE